MTAGNRADWALAAGDLQEARHQADVMRAAGWRTDDAVLSAVLTDLDGDTASALDQLQRVLASRAVGQQALLGVLAALSSALIHLREHRRATAEVSLRDALTRMAPQRILYPMVRLAADNPAFERLVARAAGGATPHPFAADALDALRRYRRPYVDLTALRLHGGHAAEAPTAGTARSPAPLVVPLVVPLTQRETDVLRELALGGSYLDIATSLYVTENTVKTHIASVYRKLGVERRASALRRARNAGLLE